MRNHKAFEAFKEDLRHDPEYLDRLSIERKKRAEDSSYDVLVVKIHHILNKIFNEL